MHMAKDKKSIINVKGKEIAIMQKNNSDFKIEANMKNTECKIKGVLISNPICEIPKIPFLTNQIIIL